MSKHQPPFQLTHAMLSRVAEIAKLLGRWRQANRDELVPQLRRGNRIRTIQASLAIEQNTLSHEQVTAALDGKAVMGLPRENSGSAQCLCRVRGAAPLASGQTGGFAGGPRPAAARPGR